MCSHIFCFQLAHLKKPNSFQFPSCHVSTCKLYFLPLFFVLFLILLVMDFFDRNEVSVCRYRSSSSMVCLCVAHQKLIDLSCALHVVSPAAPHAPQFFFSPSPSHIIVSFPPCLLYCAYPLKIGECCSKSY